jgi:hypothetical protein
MLINMNPSENMYLRYLTTLGIHVERPRLPRSFDIRSKILKYPDLAVQPIKVWSLRYCLI